MKDNLFAEISIGRPHLKRQKIDIPNASKIYGKDSKYGQLQKNISLTAVPQGVLLVWIADYQDASLPSSRELLSILEGLRTLELGNVSDQNTVNPI